MKKYGIRGVLPPNDPMRGEHLLGPDWQWVRWYDSEQERDAALRQLQARHPHYRIGDQASQILHKTER